ncbi:MAG: glutamyl-tRNA reductase [Polyangiaceae bacterium]
MIVVVGLSHRTAPIEVRERIALSKDQIALALKEIVQQEHVNEAMLVSTCNRVELVAAGNGEGTQLDLTAADAVAALSRIAPQIKDHLYFHTGADAVRHLFRVASSLDSLVLGEPQILGQVKDAFERARGAGTVGRCLHRTVPRALRTAKRVRTETQVGAGQVSVPSVGVDLARQIFGDLSGRTMVLLGSGEMAETSAKLLKNAGCKLVVVGRNAARVSVLARAVGGEGMTWDRLEDALVQADVVVTSTSAPGFVVARDLVAGLRRKRKGRSLFFIDLAVPRDVDPAVEQLDNVFLYNVDDLSRVVAETLASRAREAERAEAIVAEETAGWERWADAELATPAVVALREQFASVLERELERSLRGRLKHLEEADRQALHDMIDSALNKLLHNPTQRLRQRALAGGEADRAEQLAHLVEELFTPDESVTSSRSVPPPGVDHDAASHPRPTGSDR